MPIEVIAKRCDGETVSPNLADYGPGRAGGRATGMSHVVTAEVLEHVDARSAAQRISVERV